MQKQAEDFDSEFISPTEGYMDSQGSEIEDGIVDEVDEVSVMGEEEILLLDSLGVPKEIKHHSVIGTKSES
jgi:hypothetical protein